MIYVIKDKKLEKAHLVVDENNIPKRLFVFERLGKAELKKIYDELTIFVNPRELKLASMFRDFNNDMEYIQELINGCNKEFDVREFHQRMIGVYSSFYTFYKDAYPYIKIKLLEEKCANIYDLITYFKIANRLNIGVTTKAKETYDILGEAQKNMRVLSLAKQINNLE